MENIAPAPKEKGEFDLSQEQLVWELEYAEAMEVLTGNFPMPKAYIMLLKDYERIYGDYKRHVYSEKEALDIKEAHDKRNKEYLGYKGIDPFKKR